MPKVFPAKRRLRVSLATTEVIGFWNEGVSLAKDSGQSVVQLLQKVAADRWSFAAIQYRHASTLMNQSAPLYRSAISRYYYAMYHAMRACVFLACPGDDHQKHSELPLNVPKDFDPKGANWQGKLKDARLARNRADYEPYPKANTAWRSTALATKSDAKDLLKTSRIYLRKKGCSL
jgi:uncharacterized protein (UPF0332 family)